MEIFIFSFPVGPGLCGVPISRPALLTPLVVHAAPRLWRSHDLRNGHRHRFDRPPGEGHFHQVNIERTSSKVRWFDNYYLLPSAQNFIQPTHCRRDPNQFDGPVHLGPLFARLLPRHQVAVQTSTTARRRAPVGRPVGRVMMMTTKTQTTLF